MTKSVLKPIFLVFDSRKHVLIAIALAAIMAFLAILIPSLLTPGNTLKLQLSLLQITDIGLIVLFSLLFGIAISMQLYASHKEKTQGSHIVKGTGTGLVAFIGTLFSAKLCPICLGAILGFVGIGGSATLFLFSYKNEIMVVSILIILFMVYLTGKRITKIKVCENCK
ncbi:hypothetical protein COV18_00260 [Candidatus Woesearchaeota archaeon CG10_big_fil_rev_8_21_14_0_10_37_12]|nr:MAG: hypothetical protein COV18_00260 [Candidatus Woesearchaeota archaeon CG10_big_fil_rev_8_21_14_0_10_37_12]